MPAAVTRRLLGYFRPYLGRIALAVVLATLGSQIPTLLLFVIRTVLDEVLIARDGELLGVMPFAIVGLYAANGVLNAGRMMMTRTISWEVVTSMRNTLYRKMLSLDIGWHQSVPSGERVNRLMADVNNLQYATSGVFTALQKPLTLIGLVIAAFVMNPTLAAVALLVMPLVAFPIAKFGKNARQYTREASEAAARLAAATQETLSGIRVVQIFGGESDRAGRFGSLNQTHHDAQLRALTAQLMPGPIVEVIAAVGVGAAIWLGGKQVFSGEIQPGELIAFLVALGLMNQPLKGLAELGSMMQRSLASAEVIFGLLDTPPALKDNGAQAAPEPQRIRLTDVGFCYGDEVALSNIHLDVHIGQRIAFVGASGAGKSTLLALLARLRDPTSGSISWNDTNIRDFTLESLRRRIAVVTQEPFLFDDTVAANIRFGQPDATDEDVIAAATVANAHGFISALPAGYQTRIDELGMRLSGGQRQRICIARAVLRDAPVLLLDEATSNLDAESEALVQQALDRLVASRPRFTFVVAHRLSTIRDADCIMVLADGRIVEQGTHSQLMAAGGEYARLVERQQGDRA